MLSESFVIVRVEKRFMSQIYEIERLSFDNPYTPQFLDALARLHSESFLIAKKDDIILGYAVASIHKEFGHIISIAVHPQYRRLGVGKALMSKIIETLKSHNIKNVILEVKKSNTPAQRLYEKIGFRRIGEIKSYYEDGEDAFVFSLAIG
jgi:ribosomal-protein-alanine N-acetyltransferase